jgi:hypothetical protein
VLAAAGAVIGAWAQSAPVPVIHPVALTDDPVPGIAGAYFDILLPPQIDAAGNVLFEAFLYGPIIDESNYMAVLYGPPDDPQVVVWMGQQAPDMPEGVLIGSLLEQVPCVSETGRLAFAPRLVGPDITAGINDKALFVGPPGDFRKVLQGGDQAPGCESGVYIDVSSGLGFGGILSDHATLRACAYLGGPGVTTDNDRVFWTGDREGLGLAYREGMPAPGLPAGIILIGMDYPAHDDAGQLGFRGFLQGPGITSANYCGHWLGPPGALAKTARESEPADMFGPGVTWKTVGRQVTEINSMGDLAELAFIQGTGVSTADDDVLLVIEPDGCDVLGREGDSALGAEPGVYLSLLGTCLINDGRQAFYYAKLAGEGVTAGNQWALYFGRYAAPGMTMRSEDPAPTFPPGTVLTDLGGPALAALSDTGYIAMPTQIAGPGVSDADKVVLWLRHAVVQRWVPLLRSGAQLAGRTVYASSGLDFNGFGTRTGGADGQPQSLNDAGMLAICLDFTDGSQGVFRIDPPVFGDADGDGDLDGGDLALSVDCWTGLQSAGLPPDCDVFDLDVDSDFDLADWAMLQQLQR